eukprot:TRINITY_DN26467_c0_g1_i1.p1 TRINITY_DN26467_c0_g1~~TRINITY_DN26467_c0_g1_i1.p1  ORF type:complete len:1248 (+),score=283.84 TRINITY_DN26467_c0_g1_i1:65-3745(+)
MSDKKALVIAKEKPRFVRNSGALYDQGLVDAVNHHLSDDGKIDLEEAKQIWELCTADNAVSPIELRTLKKLLKDVKFVQEAKEFLSEKVTLLTATVEKSGVSQYKTINKIRYERELLDLSDHYVIDGVINVSGAEMLWMAAMDGGRVTDTEHRTLRYIMETKNVDENGKKFLAEKLESVTPRKEVVQEATAEDCPVHVSDETSKPEEEHDIAPTLVSGDTADCEKDASKSKRATAVRSVLDAQASAGQEWNDKLIQLFDEIDKNGNGVLSHRELKAYVSDKDPGARLKLGIGRWKDFMAAVDTDGDMQISRDEFLAFFVRANLNPQKCYGALFDAMDKDANGILTYSEIKAWEHCENPRVFEMLGVKSWRDLVATLDSDGDGQVSRSEFVSYYSKKHHQAEDMKGLWKKPEEKEKDAPADSRATVSVKACVSTLDATINAMPTANGKLLMSLSDGGSKYLLAGVRSNIGMKSGRYFFEAKIVEFLAPKPRVDHTHPQPGPVVRVGVSAAGSSLFMPDVPLCACFDAEGLYAHQGCSEKVCEKFGRDEIIAVLVNLDATSANANTLSLFKGGRRMSQPQPLPECLKGKTLFPTITYRNVTLQVNFGRVAFKELPFECRLLADAAVEDVDVSEPSPQQPREVVFPIALPDTGASDWIDMYKLKNPYHSELSDREVCTWSARSGFPLVEGEQRVPKLEDGSVKKLLRSVAPALERDFIVVEPRMNLLAEERRKLLAGFTGPNFKKVAVVVMGEPDDEYKAFVQNLVLKEKQHEAEQAHAKREATKQRKRLLEERRQKVQHAKKARIRDDEQKHEEVESEAKEEQQEEDAQEDQPIELAEEEKQQWYRKLPIPEMSATEISRNFAKFSLPSKEEGFDEIKYVWQPEEASADIMRAWILGRKRTQRAEDLQPSQWFKDEWNKWTKHLQVWRQLHGAWKDQGKREQLLAKAKEERIKAAGQGKEGDEKEDAEKEAERDVDIDMDELDVFQVNNVSDVGSGEPLFSNFAFEDWTLLSLRYELHILMHAFKRDLNDPDRVGIPEAHLPFYYQKYFKKDFSLKQFRVQDLSELLELVRGVGNLTEDKMLEPALPVDLSFDNVLKSTELFRRDRQRRADAGDESCILRFPKPAASAHGSSQGSSQRGPPALARRSSGNAPPPPGSGGGRSGYGSGNSVKRTRDAESSSSYPPAKRQNYDYSYSSGRRASSGSYGSGSGDYGHRGNGYRGGNDYYRR